MTLITEYRDWMISLDLRPNTVAQRCEFAERWLGIWQTFDVPPARAVEWLQQYTGWTKRTYFNNLRSLYRWLAEAGIVDHSPIERVRMPASPPPRPNPLSPSELTTVLDQAEGRVLAFLLLGYLAGLRCFEIAKFHGADITETTIFVAGKGGQECVLPTHPALWTLAQQYPRDDYWFPSTHRERDHIGSSLVELRIREHFRACGVETGAVHRLRHSYGTSLDRAGVRPRVLQELMRHRSLDTTMRYTLVEQDEKMRDVQLLPLPARLRPPTPPAVPEVVPRRERLQPAAASQAAWDARTCA